MSKKEKEPSMHRWIPDPHGRGSMVPNKKKYTRKKSKKPVDIESKQD